MADLIDRPDAVSRYHKLSAILPRDPGRDVFIDTATAVSERSSGHHSRTIVRLMPNFGSIRDRVQESLDLDFQQWSLLVHCRDLAAIGATLASGGVNPMTTGRPIPAEFVNDLPSILLSCNRDEYAGDRAYHMGLPAKSGVSGGIVVGVPGVAGMGLC